MIPASPHVVLVADNPNGSGALIVTKAWTGTLTGSNTFPLTSVRVQNTSNQKVAGAVLINGTSTLSGSVAAGFDHTFTALGGATTDTGLELDSSAWG